MRKSCALYTLFFAAAIFALGGCASGPRTRYKLAMFDRVPAEPQFGIASWYHANWFGVGEKMANGKRFKQYEMTCAHKTLPLGTFVLVTNVKNGRSTIAKITDRGPYVPNRIVDLSKTGAREIGILDSGLAPVKLEVLVPRNSRKAGLVGR